MRRSRPHVVLVLVALLAGLLLGGGGVPPLGQRPRGARGLVPRRAGGAEFLGLDNPRHRVVCRPDSARRIDRMQPGALKRRNRALLEECRFGSIQTAVNSIARRHLGLRAPRRLLRAPLGEPADVVVLRQPRHPLRRPGGRLAVHRQPLLPRQRERRRGPGRAGLLRPGALPAQPQPDHDLRRRHPGNRSIDYDSRFCRHPAGRHRRLPPRRADRQPVRQAQRDPRRPGRRGLLPQLHRAAGGVQRSTSSRPTASSWTGSWPAATTSTASSRSPATTG